MQFVWPSIVVFISGYLVGSIPWGFIAGKAKGLDIREHGSGNIGATNVFRVMGKGWGSLVFFLDFLKGLLCGLLGGVLGAKLGLPPDIGSVLGGISAILGHNFTPWLGFKGGKGIASSAGVLVGVTPIVALCAVIAWAALFFSTRYVSLGSLAAAISLPLATLLLMIVPAFQGLPGGTVPLMIFCSLACVLAFYRHKENIGRLLNGTESRFLKKASSKSAESQ